MSYMETKFVIMRITFTDHAIPFIYVYTHGKCYNARSGFNSLRVKILGVI